MMPATKRLTRRRGAGCLVTMLLVALLLAGRLAQLTLVQGERLLAAARRERLATIPLPAPRGAIEDRNGIVLAMDVPMHAAFADPEAVSDPQGEARALAGLLGVPEATLVRLLERRTTYVELAPQVPEAAYQKALRLQLPGVYFEPVDVRVYPAGSLFGPVVGFVGQGAQGLAGLEAYYNRELVGRPGVERAEVDAAGNPLLSLPHAITPARPGDTLVTTLDSTIQQFAQSALDQAIHRTHSRSGRILVLNPQTGAILAMAQWPTADPNRFWRYPLADWSDQLVQDAYPPGSTFKPITAAAALLDGVITTHSVWYDGGTKVINGVTLHGWEWPRKFGWVDFDRAMALSSDIAYMDIGLALGAQRLEAFARRIGVMTPTGIDLPGESAGVWLPAAQARPIDVANMAFGQSMVITPVQLAAAIAAVADGGVWHQPHVGKELVTAHGRVVPLVWQARRVMPRWVADDVVQAMEHVISPQGTGALAAVPGYRLAGKTGTSQVPHGGGYQPGAYMASFIGYGPVPHPRVLVLVQLSHPVGQYYGGDIAAPVFAQVMGETLRYLGIPPQTAPAVRPRTVSVPDVQGTSLAHAFRLLVRAGLVPTVSGGGGRVVAVSPAPGTRLLPGQGVALTTGPLRPPVRVPDLRGLTVALAARLLLALHLELVPQGGGVLVRQSPKAGTAVRPGSVVHGVFGPG